MRNPNRSKAFQRLKDQNIAAAHVHFSGGGDEGGVESIDLLDKDGNTVRSLEEWYATSKYDPATNTWIRQTSAEPDEELSSWLSAPVYERYGTFAGEFYVRGTIIWDVAAETVKAKGQERSSSYDDFEESY